jgi:hypothetical protein
MLGDGARKEIFLVPLSNDIISWQIDDMSSDIQSHAFEKLSGCQVFSLQLDGALKTRLLRQMCHEAGSHDTLVLHTDIRWLSKGKVLARFFELKNELLNMFSIENPDFAVQLNDEEWCAKVAYLADIFSHLTL